jgi:putative SOS response-associated peptidase YedK
LKWSKPLRAISTASPEAPGHPRLRPRHAGQNWQPAAYSGVYPDYFAPIVRNAEGGERELVMARWGMPGPLQFGGQPVTNIRNVASPHWRGWLSAGNRCLVPATSFCDTPIRRPAKPRRGSL